MATRVDFYVLDVDEKLEFIGSTVNEYYGDFEKAVSLQTYLKSVRELLKENNSIEGKWYWPWKTSNISDEVFVFKVTYQLFNWTVGKTLSKVYVDGEDRDENYLWFADYNKRYEERYMVSQERGLYNKKFAQKIRLPRME